VYLLDTNHCSRIIEDDSAVVERVRTVGEDQVATCVTVYGELIYMAHKSERRNANLARVSAFLSDIRIYFADERVAEVYGEFKARIIAHFGPRDRRKRGRMTIERLGISEDDLWIASVAIRHDLTVVSADADFTRMGEVWAFPLECWWQPAASS